MQINAILIDDTITHLALVGRMDVAGLQGNDIKFSGYTAARRKPTLVDMSQVEFIGSLGIGLFINGARALARHGAKLVLLNPQEMVVTALKTVGLDQDIPMVFSKDEAMRLLGLSS